MVRATTPDLEARNRAVRESQDQARDKAAVIFMCNWMRRKGVPKDKLLDLTDWSASERDEICQIYRYRYT